MIAVFAMSLGVARGAQAEPSKRLLRVLAAPASVRWTDAPIGPALDRLAAATRVPLWVDRRVDPDQRITLSFNEGSLAELLDRATARLDLGAAAIDEVVYFGPKRSAAAAPDLAAAWRKSPPRGMRSATPLAWTRLTTPRDLALEIAQEAGCRIENPERLPHDLWPAGSAPRLARGDQLLLVGLGFDLRWRRASSRSRRLRFEPIDLAATPSAAPSLADWVRSAPKGPPAERRYTLRVVNQPLEPVLRQLATQLGLTLRLETPADQLAKRVSFQVSEATLETLLAEVSAAARATIRRDGSQLIVEPTPSK